MVEVLTCPYEKILSSNVWTVDALMFSNQHLAEVERKPLAQLAEINPIRVKPITIQDNFSYPYIEIKSINIETGGVNPQLISGKELPTRAKLIAKPGDVLLSIVRPERSIIAKIPKNHEKYIVSNSLVVLTPKPEVSTETLYSMLKTEDVTNELKVMSTGTTIPFLSLKQIKEYQVPVLYSAESEQDYVKDKNATYKASSNQMSGNNKEIIEAVFHSLLESEKIQNANHAVVSYSELVSSDRFDAGFYIEQLNHQVKWKDNEEKLGFIVEDIRVGKSISPNIKNTEVTSDALRYLTVKNVSYDSVYTQEDDVTYIDANKVPTESGVVEENNIVVVRQGFGKLGLSALVSKEFTNALANHLLMIIKVNEKKVLPKYLVYFLRTKWVKQQVKTLSIDKAGRFLSQNSLKQIIIPLPDIGQQQNIIDQIEGIQSKSDGGYEI